MERVFNRQFLLDFFFLSLISVYIGFAFFSLTDPALINPSNKEEIKENVVLAPEKISPSEIKIPKLKKDLSISASVISDGVWQLFDDKVAWLSTSQVPGQGNAILYAHNRKNLFAGLNLLVKGDVIEVLQEGVWLKFKVVEVKKVLPTDVEAVISDKNRLTLYTCEGSFDQKRLVVYAETE